MKSKRRIVLVDDFYGKPHEVRRVALRRKFVVSEGVTGWRTRPYHPKGIRQIIQRKFDIRIADWNREHDDLAFANVVFMCALASGSRAERIGVHADWPLNTMALVVYLTPKAPLDTGTSLWRHRRTGLVSWPTERDAKRLKIPKRALEEILERDSEIRNRWEEIDRIGNVYNRAVLFHSNMLHSATRHFGRTIERGRLYQSFNFILQ